MKVKEEEIGQLSGILGSSSEDWMQEKASLVHQVTDLKLAMASLEEGYKQEIVKYQASLVEMEELEIELDRLQREIASLKSVGMGRKQVSWASNSILETIEPSMISPRPLVINTNKSHNRYDSTGSGESSSRLCCNLSIKVPHNRSKSIPPTVSF